MADIPPDRTTARPPLPITLFTAAYIIIAAVAALAAGNAEFLFYIAVLIILAAAVALVHARMHLSRPLLWLLTVWGLLHMAGGLLPVPDSWPIDGDTRVLYSWWIIPRDGVAPGQLGGWLKYDHILHAYGYAVTALLLWQVLRGLVLQHTGSLLRPTIGMMVLVVAAATGFGALNEVVEFSTTLFAQTNVGGYVNTGIDLICNLLGALIAATIILFFKHD